MVNLDWNSLLTGLPAAVAAILAMVILFVPVLLFVLKMWSKTQEQTLTMVTKSHEVDLKVAGSLGDLSAKIHAMPAEMALAWHETHKNGGLSEDRLDEYRQRIKDSETRTMEFQPGDLES